MIGLILKYIFLLGIFGIIFSLVPKYSFRYVKKLLSYPKYNEEIMKKRFWEVIRTYLVLGMALGLVFIILFSIDSEFNLKQISGEDTGFESRVLFAFLTSFSLVIILRTSTLLNKSNIIAGFLPSKVRARLLESSTKFDYKGLRNEITSFLFSIFLTTLLTMLIYSAYRLIFFRELIIKGSFVITGDTVLKYILVLFIFIVSLVLVTLSGELILHQIGVRPSYGGEEHLSNKSEPR